MFSPYEARIDNTSKIMPMR